MRRVKSGDMWVTAVVAVILLIPLLLLSDLNRYVATSGVIMAIAILGLGVVTGRTGLISLAQVSLMAVGTWVVMYLQVHAPGMPFLAKLAIGTIATVPIGVLLSVPALRLRGINLAVVTLAFASAVDVFLRVQGFPGVATGVYVTRPSFVVDDTAYYCLCAVVFIVLLVGVTLIGRSSVGSSWSGVRESERATAALGRSVPLAKMSAFAVSAACAGAAGSLLAGQLGTADPATFAPLASLSMFALAIMVGSRYGEGALIGGALFAFMPLILPKLGLPRDVGDVLFGVGAVIGLSRGFGIAEDLRDALHRRSRRKAEAVSGPPVPAAAPSAGRPHAQTVHAGPPALQVQGLTQLYGAVRALDDVTVEVQQGMVAALIGPNGAGKSTLIDCVTGFLRGYSGSILVSGREMEPLNASQRSRAGVRRTFQQGRTIPDLTIQQYIRLGLSARSAHTQDELDEVLDFFGCPTGGTRVGDIDVGTRRLLEVAAAVAARPALVLLDEPAAGLGGAASVRLAHQIAAIPERFGSAVLLVEHDIELVSLAATHLVVLDFGCVIAAGAPETVLAESQVVDAYLGREVAV